MDWLSWFLGNVVAPLAVPVAVAIGWDVTNWMKQRGYRTAYADALLRAVGEGNNQARLKGYSLFEPEGRLIATNGGADYLIRTVSKAAQELGIDREGSRLRVDAQIGAMEVQAEIAARAAERAMGGEK